MASPATVSVPSSARIKGIAFERLLDWYGREHGDARLRRILESLPVELRALVDAERGSVLVNVWYPAELAHRLLDGMCEGLGPAQRSALAQAGAEAIVRSSLRGVYKVLFQLFMTPERYARRAQTLWDRYYDSGVVEKTIVGPQRHHAVVRDWKSHHPILCEMNQVTGRIIYEELGCRNVRSIRESCVADGAAVCAQVVTWDG